MRFYLDTSAVVPIFEIEEHSSTIVSWQRANHAPICFSDFGALEFFAVVSRYVRMRKQNDYWASRAIGDFETWRKNVIMLSATSNELGYAERAIRNFQTKLAAADALHLAMAACADATLVTFDRRQAAAAQMLNVRALIPA